MSDIALAQKPTPTSQGTVVEQTRAAAEVAAAVAVARDFPRNQALASEELKALCSRLAVAQRAFYEVPNRGAGLSVHIARELALIWRNVDYGVRELARDDLAGTSEMSVWAWDQEANVRSTRSVIQPHAKSIKGGGRKALTDLNDIYLNNQNTGARAVRECIFSIIPDWFIKDAEAMLRATMERGDGKPIGQRQLDAVSAFKSIHVEQKRLEDHLKKPMKEWSAGDLADLARIHTSVTVDGIPVDEFFPEQTVTIPGAKAKEIDPASPDYIAPSEVR